MGIYAHICIRTYIDTYINGPGPGPNWARAGPGPNLQGQGPGRGRKFGPGPARAQFGPGRARAHLCMYLCMYVYIYIYTGRPPPGSRNRCFAGWQVCWLTNGPNLVSPPMNTMLIGQIQNHTFRGHDGQLNGRIATHLEY